MPAMQSLKCFSEHLILSKISYYLSQQLEHIIPIYFILKLLKDEKIRILASEIELLNLLINLENINELQTIVSYPQETNNLFIHEKRNLWRDTLKDNSEIIKALALLNDNGYIVNKLTIWANSFAKTLLQIIIEKGYDDHLG
ncbi:hypothetical protein T552_03460 [Pneumocystis carinii B80]|uniref:Uncharacterized protein n=1 Tax=Pneumocystis carinii (strain B80) TaxID=1408658 RepID=A0A0W4ZAX6_PNEC8|nr:hypothetical protein T552_03460 [Pneumocystis carinii B80]KTW25600.1 hypothetical protein T552_03460 [Pneumocystis carinii B80]